MNFKKYISVFCIGAILLSCDNFEDINTNSDSLTKVNSTLLATGGIMGIMKPSTGANFLDHLFVSKYMAWGEGSRGAQYNDFGRDNFGGYTAIKDYRLMAELAEDQDKEAYEALCLFLESYKVYNMTISMGDIPYAEILQGKEGVLTPRYDTQKDIFKALLNNLDRSYNLFGEAKNFSGDPIFGGDVAKWRKVVATFQLRVLINLSKKESDTDLNIKAKFNEVYKRGGLMESNSDNLQLEFSDKAGQIYPFHHSQNKHATYPMLSTTLFNILKKHEDYRLFYYAAPSVARLAAGVPESDWEAYPGVDPSAPIEDIKAIFTTDEFCNLNERYVTYISGEPYILMGYAEQSFILAEAALRGWIDVDPAQFYKAGIKASLDFITEYTPDDILYHHDRKITTEVVEELLNKPSMQLAGSFDQKIEMILEQKYVAAFMHLPYQTFYDYRRTGYPVFPINPETNKNFKEPTKIPVRWMYPDVEYGYNRENVEEALQSQYDGIDEVNKLMWILK